MRQVIFRSLAGILALLFIWVLVVKSFPARQLVGFIFITALFAAYAVFGDGTANSLLGSLSGGAKKRTDRLDSDD